ncbi:hypothetical protein D3C78_1455870 [compost metagenome]
MFADHSGTVSKAMREQCAGRIEQQARSFDGVTCYCYKARFLALQSPLRICVDHTSRATLGIMFDFHRVSLCAKLKLASGLGRRNFGVER